MLAAATPPAKPALTPEQRRAAMLAGGIVGGLFGIGWGILGVVGDLRGGGDRRSASCSRMLFGGADVTGGLGVVLIVLLLVGLAVGVVLVILSVVISQRILRKGGVNRPTAVTWLSLLIVLVVNTIAQRVASPFIDAFGDVEVPAWSRVVVSIVLGLVAVGAGIGVVAAHGARLPRLGAQRADTAGRARVFPPDTATAAAPAAAPGRDGRAAAVTMTNPPAADAPPPTPPAA